MQSESDGDAVSLGFFDVPLWRVASGEFAEVGACDLASDGSTSAGASIFFCCTCWPVQLSAHFVGGQLKLAESECSPQAGKTKALAANLSKRQDEKMAPYSDSRWRQALEPVASSATLRPELAPFQEFHYSVAERSSEPACSAESFVGQGPEILEVESAAIRQAADHTVGGSASW